MPLITPTFSQGEKVGPVEMALVDAAIREVANWFYDLFGQQQTVMPGGFAMMAQAGPGINFQQAGGRCFINGDRGIIPAGPFTCNSNSDPTNHRYDLVTVQYTEPSGTDSAGQAEAVDTFAVIVVPGVVAGSPVLPSLPVNAVQIGWVDVGPNATTSAGCTAHSSAADQGPFVFVSYQAFANHMNASLANSVVHGYQATSPGGTGALQLAQTDSQGRVGHAVTADSATTAVSAGSAQTAVNASNATTATAAVNASNANTLGGIGPSGFQPAGNYPILDANGRVPDSVRWRGRRVAFGTSGYYSIPTPGLSITIPLDDNTFIPSRAFIQQVGGNGHLSAGVTSLSAGSATIYAFNDDNPNPGSTAYFIMAVE